MKKLDTLSIQEQDMATDVSQSIKHLYGPRLKSIIFFGSRVRGKARRDSDADFLVLLHELIDPLKEIQRLSTLVSDLSTKHGIIISAVPFKAESFDAPSAPEFVHTIRQEGITLDQ